MLKFMCMLLMMIPLLVESKVFWLMNNLLLFIAFIFILNNNFLSYWKNIGYSMGCDIMSYGLILLSLWIGSLMLMASEKFYSLNNFYYLFLFMVIMLLIFLFLTFSSMNLFLFYVYFESSLIPTFFLILGWGYQPERLQAGFYLLFYTLLASLPLLMGIFYCYMNKFSMVFNIIDMNSNNFMFYLSMILAFLVKMPMYLFHLWLPKAHVEAPISGSMILAGVLLKLGGYGLLRIFPFLMYMGMKYNLYWIIISLTGGFFVSLMCLLQLDLSMLIAYSSVAHMGLALSGLMTLMYWGLVGSYILMIGHGLCSSGLFCLANINYERSGSRSMLINKGMMNFIPSMTFWWFLLSACNMACPPSLNLLGEIILLNSMVSWSFTTMLLISFLSFFSAAYSLYLFSFTQHGKLSLLQFSYSGGLVREYLLLFLHWFPLNLLILGGECSYLWI